MSELKEVSLSPWYINTRRLNALLKAHIPAEAQVSLNENSLGRSQAMAYAADVAERLMKSGQVPTFHSIYQRLTKEDYTLCYFWGATTFKDVSAALSARRSAKSPNFATFYGKTLFGSEEFSLSGNMSNDHYYSNSVKHLASGTKKAYVCGFARLLTENSIEVTPIIIGDLTVEISNFTFPAKNQFRVYPSQVDNFRYAKDAKAATKADTKSMLLLSEEEVKNAFADIVGEPFVSKDWGGEKSDLVTSRLIIDGQPTSAAFIFKGPSVSGPLRLNKMGKNGDQLPRAFDEPAELIVIQHCAAVDGAVIKVAEAFCANPANPRRFLILDGGDCGRLLKSHPRYQHLFSN